MKRKQIVVLAIAGLALAFIPLLMSSATIDPVLIPRFTALAAILGAMGIGLLFSKETAAAPLLFMRSKQAWPFYLFFVTGLIALGGAINFSEAIFTLVKDVMFFLFMLLLMQAMAGNLARIYFLIRALLVGGFIIAGFGAIQSLQAWQMDGPADLYLVRSTMAHRNLLVSALVLLLPFSGYATLWFRRFWKWFALLVFLISLALIGLLQSRTGWLALAVSVCFVAGVQLAGKIGLGRIKLPLQAIAMAIVVFSLGGFLIFYTATPAVESNAELKTGLGFENPGEKEFTIDERIFMWKATGRMINEQSFFGVGPGNWKIWFPKYGSDIWRARQGLVQFQRPHNDFLWVLSEQGILGLLAYGFMGLAALYCGFRLIFSSTAPPVARQLVTLVLASLVAYVLVAFFSFPRERVVHQIVVYTGFAMVFSLYFEPDVPLGPSKLKSLPAWMAVVVVPMLFVVGFQRWKGEVQTKKILTARASGQWAMLLNHSAPIENSRFYNLDPTSVPIAFYSGLGHLNLKENERALDEFKKAYRQHPFNIHVVNNLAGIYQLMGNSPKALEFYRKALEISPKYLEGALNLIAANFNAGQVEEAYRLLRRYYPLFLGEGAGDARYREYALVVLHTLRDNLKDAHSDEALKQRLDRLTDEELLRLHSTNWQNNTSIYKILEKRVVKSEGQ